MDFDTRVEDRQGREMFHSCSTDHISCLVTYHAFSVSYRLSSNYNEVPRKLASTDV